ncbi:hypothetical protein AMAG_06820 [Allomyces macrogynus ATCC 38327]|uniref:Uncharacterized protein n=1 Tax=Allomyces macrogynus (strain ATCC 38327) TaxID=578462 RepID=A0A0L0SEY8_ALLM3|nr:hypothetical protein AMAG_06820 [Allomyces macrogynus ATCC 38327]|eukprot:KNE61066.1 hypothetical protein AMAG_06820 [Allomyces macrogynus ATCC 38327]
MYHHHHHRGPPSPPGSVAGSLASSVGPAHPHQHHQRSFSHHQPYQHQYQPQQQPFQRQHARPHPPSRPHTSPLQQQRDAPVPRAVLPILGTTQSGKSTLVQFLHDYCGMRPNDPSTLQIGNGVNSMTKTSRCYSLRVPRRTALLVPVPDPVSPQLGHTSMSGGMSSIPSLSSRTPSISSSTSTAPPHAQAAHAISPMGAALDPAEDAYLSNLLQSAHAVLDDDKDPWSIDESEIPPSSPAMSWFDPHEHGLPSPRPTPSPTPPSMGPPSIRSGSGYNGMVPTAPMSNMMMPPPPPPPQVRQQVALHPHSSATCTT